MEPRTTYRSEQSKRYRTFQGQEPYAARLALKARGHSIDGLLPQNPTPAAAEDEPSQSTAAAREQPIVAEVPVENQPVASSRTPEVPPKKSNKLKSFFKNRINIMACLLLAVGLGVSAYGFWLNQKASDQIAVLAAEDGQNSSVPNEDPLEPGALGNYSVNAALPRLIRIPAIGVEARVLHLGLDAQGRVATPDGIFDTSWFTESALPADAGGAMFISGHYSGPSMPGVFYKLKDLKPGDVIEVERGDRAVKRFVVKEVKTLPLDNLDMSETLVSYDTGKLGLNLMTCGGHFDPASFHYSDRTLVRAVLAD